MIDTLVPPPVAMRVVEARGGYSPEPLEQLVQVCHDGWVGETVALRLTDRTCIRYVIDWVERRGHGLLGVYERHGYDEVIIEIRC